MEPAATGTTIGAATGATAPDGLADYRAVVDEAVRRCATGAVASALGVLDRPTVRAVLDRVPGGADRALERFEREVRAFRPTGRSNATSPAVLLRILLLHQIDVSWWSGLEPFADDAAVETSPQLVSLRALRHRRQLGFRFKVAPRGLPGRARNYAVRRYAPEREPRSSGLSYGMARPAVVGLLNEVAARFADAAPGWRHGFWVNCLVRSVAGQHRLRELGYSAFLPSAHCVGFAADVEMAWLGRQGAAQPLQDVLVRYRDAGVLNVMDEGQAWHVCLNPAWVAHYEGLAPGAGATTRP